MITKSALVYTRLVDFLPWIQNILNIGCGNRTIHFGKNLDAFVFKVEMEQTEKQWPRNEENHKRNSTKQTNTFHSYEQNY